MKRYLLSKKAADRLRPLLEASMIPARFAADVGLLLAHLRGECLISKKEATMLREVIVKNNHPGTAIIGLAECLVELQDALDAKEDASEKAPTEGKSVDVGSLEQTIGLEGVKP